MTPSTPTPTRASVLVAFAAIYVIWGSTYLAIRVAIETMPPLLMLGLRFAVAGLLMAGWALVRGAERPTLQQWRWAAVLGVLMPCCGTGAVAWAEQWVPSGLMAVLVAAVPLSVVLIDTVFLGRKRLDMRVAAGVILGFLGVAFLARPQSFEGGSWWVVAVLVGGILAWSVGSVLSRGADLPRSPVLSSGIQMLAGGVGLTLAGFAFGEASRVAPETFSSRSLVALAYLIVFGSLFAFSAYVWLLRVTSPAKVATYAYVNPVVALFLGWSLLDETLTAETLIVSGLILGSVALILTPKRPEPVPVEPAVSEPTPAVCAATAE